MHVKDLASVILHSWEEHNRHAAAVRSDCSQHVLIPQHKLALSRGNRDEGFFRVQAVQSDLRLYEVLRR